MAAAVPLAEITKQSVALAVRLVGIMVEEASAVAIVRLVGITEQTVRLVGITAATAEITAGLAPIGPKQGVRGVLDRTDPKAAGRVESSASVTRT